MPDYACERQPASLVDTLIEAMHGRNTAFYAPGVLPCPLHTTRPASSAPNSA